MELQSAVWPVPAGGAAIINRQGLFLSVAQAPSPVDVFVYRNHTEIGRAIDIDPPFSLGPFRLPYDKVEVRLNNGLAGNVTVVTSTLPVDYQRVSGIVAVRPYDETAENRQFVKQYYRAGSAGNYASIQLQNPTGSGVITTVKRAAIYNPTATFYDCQIQYNPVTLPNYAGGGFNKNAGALSTSPQCQIRYDLAATKPGAGSTFIFNSPARPQDWTEILLRDHILLPPGQSYIVSCNTLALAIAMLFEWEEN